MRTLIMSFLLLAGGQVLATEQINIDPANNIQAKGIVTATVGWIKDKKKKWDLDLHIKNENPEQGIIIFLSDMGCRRGSTVGKLKHTFFNTGERTIDFRPGQVKDFHLVCDTGNESTGAYQLEITRVYSNPSLDGKTIGKVVAKNLKWKHSDKNGAATDKSSETEKSSEKGEKEDKL